MMNNMKSGHVTVLLPEDKEERVEEFGEFREVVPPTRPRHLVCIQNYLDLGLTGVTINT